MSGASSPRGTTNRNARGSAAERRVRKQWMLDRYGDGTHAPCHYCQVLLDFLTITADRIIPGIMGGTYKRDNIRPACISCNSIHGNTLQAGRSGRVPFDTVEA